MSLSLRCPPSERSAAIPAAQAFRLDYSATSTGRKGRQAGTYQVVRHLSRLAQPQDDPADLRKPRSKSADPMQRRLPYRSSQGVLPRRGSRNAGVRGASAMTADAFADLLRARSAGRRRWMARCPAHPDRNPSLGISEAPGGAILLRCHRGCATDAILRAMKLQWRDLYTGAYPSRAQRAAIQESRESKQRAGLLFREAAVDLPARVDRESPRGRVGANSR
jgi:hypothetical protein